MITTRNNRLDPSLLNKEELDQLAAAFSAEGHVALIDNAGNRTEIPTPLYDQLMRVVRMMQKGRAVVLMPEDETFTTQAAANYLGVSRQHFVDLLEKDQIPFHKVGTHRRVTFKDLITYEKNRDQRRKDALDELGSLVDGEDLYDSNHTVE